MRKQFIYFETFNNSFYKNLSLRHIIFSHLSHVKIISPAYMRINKKLKHLSVIFKSKCLNENCIAQTLECYKLVYGITKSYCM